MRFGDIIRQLLNICHIKMTALSFYLGYDVSYISKWISGTKYPTYESIERICDGIAQYCCDNSSEQALESVKNLIGAVQTCSVKDIVLLTSAYLRDAYIQDKPQPVPQVGNSQLNYPANAESANEYQDGLIYVLTDALRANNSREVEVIISAGSFILIKDFISSFMDSAKNSTLTLHIFYDPRSFESETEYCRFIYSACAQYKAVSCILYEVNVPRLQYSDPVCIVRGFSMFHISFNMLGVSFPVYTTDTTVVNEQFDSVLSFIANKKIEFYSYGDSHYERYLFKFFLSKRPEPICFLANELLFNNIDCLSNDELRSVLIDAGNNSARLKWQSSLSSAKDSGITEIFYETTVIDFCRSGKWRTSSNYVEPVIVDSRQRRLILDVMIKSIQNNNASIYILADENPVMNHTSFDASIAKNGEMVCIIPKGAGTITYLKSDFAVKCFDKLFHDLRNLSNDFLYKNTHATAFLQYAMHYIP